MTITHSKTLSPGGASVAVNVSEAANSVPVTIPLCDWLTEKREPQELEVLVYPTFNPDQMPYSIKTQPLQERRLPVFGRISVLVRYAMSGAGTSSFEHFAEIPLSDHGVKFRVSARSLRLQLLATDKIACNVNAAMAPVIGGDVTPVFPASMLAYVEKYAGHKPPPDNGWPIPYGAREFRCSQPRVGTGGDLSAFPPSVDRPGYNWITQKQVNAAAGVGTIVFLTCNATAVSGWPVDQIGGANDSLVEDPRSYAMSYEWQPIPGEASRFKAVAASATVFFR